MAVSFADIQNPESIRQAIAEFDEIGQAEFLSKYGFGPAKSYYVVENGNWYDSKAIIGAAHGYEFPALGPLTSETFSGGELTVERKLTRLGFRVEHFNKKDGALGFSSETLIQGLIYTRKELRAQFNIGDATVNNGVFKPKGYRSVWLFVTEKKTPDRPQLVDLLDGDTLLWQGQPQGRTDDWIIDHVADGNELLVFYRLSRSDYPQGGFRYEGKFRYQSHQGQKPANFVLVRDPDALVQLATEIEQAEPFDPANLEDGRKKTLAAVVRRQGQKSFRDALLKAYARVTRHGLRRWRNARLGVGVSVPA